MTPTSDIPENTADWARPLHERQIDYLGDVAESGVEIARQVARIAKDAWDVDGVHTAALAHSRVARAVRLTVMLQAKLIKALEDRDAHRADLASSDADDERQEKQARTIRIVERVAEQDDRDRDEVDRLVRETAERLDTDDIYKLLDRPLSELIAMICKDLGLDPDWPRLAQEAWAQAEMASGGVGWPLADLKPAGSPATLIQGCFRPSG